MITYRLLGASRTKSQASRRMTAMAAALSSAATTIMMVAVVMTVIPGQRAMAQSPAPVCVSGDPKILDIEQQLSGRAKLHDNINLETWRTYSKYGVAQPVSLSFGSTAEAQAALSAAAASSTAATAAPAVSNGLPQSQTSPARSARSRGRSENTCSTAAPIVATAAGGVRGIWETIQPLDAAVRSDVNKKDRQKGLSRECIRRALANRSIGSPNFIACSSDHPFTKKGLRTLKGEPCASEAYVDYLHWTVNRALKCLSSADHPVDPQVLFKKLNFESGLRAFIQHESGIGLMQLTTVAATEMTSPEPGYAFLENLMRRRKEDCAGLDVIASAPLQIERASGGPRAAACQFSSIGDGVARSLLKGIGLFLYYRDGRPGSTSDMLKKTRLVKSPDYQRMEDYLTLVAFRLGPGGQSILFDKIKRKIGRKTDYAAFKKLVDSQSSYTTMMDDAMKPLFNDKNHDCTEAL